MTIILNMRKIILEAVPYALVRRRTASLILEHTEYFPNVIRSLPENPERT